jgi:hypothetical protein
MANVAKAMDSLAYKKPIKLFCKLSAISNSRAPCALHPKRREFRCTFFVRTLFWVAR